MPLPASNDAFLDMIDKSKLVDRKLVDEALQGQPAFPNPTKLAIFLVKKGLLTKFQAEQILQGRYNLNIGKYKILDLIGRGGMGSVYLCEHVTMRRRVALKVLPSSKSNDPSVVERFFREARAVGILNHPNIVQAHDVDSVGKTHFLVMEYVEGINLHDLVRKTGTLAIERAAYYIRQSAEGLQHAFEAGLIHRDIKPANLLLSRQGGIKILDMGLARFFHDEQDNLTQKFDSSAVLGTVDYLAPEQSMDSHGVDIRADIYSLGATLYFLLTARAPFASGTMAQKLVSINMQEPTPIRELRPEVPEAMAKVLARMMAKQVDVRFQRPEEVAAALAPWAEKFQPNPEVDFPKTNSKLQLGGLSTNVAGDEFDKTETIPKPRSKLSGLKTTPAEELTRDSSSTQVMGSAASTVSAVGLPNKLRVLLGNRRLKMLAIAGSCAAAGLLLLTCSGLLLFIGSGPSVPVEKKDSVSPEAKLVADTIPKLDEKEDRHVKLAAIDTLTKVGKDAAAALPNLAAIRKRELDKPDGKRDNDLLKAADGAIERISFSLVALGPWQFIGPFDNPNKAGFKTVYPPEKEIDLTKKYPGKNGTQAVWQKGKFKDGEVNNLAIFESKNNQWAVVYLYREFDCERPMEAAVSLGSDDTLSVWLNGERLLNEDIDREPAPDQNRLTLKLKKGKNQFLMKICQGVGDWAFYFKLTGVNANPVK